MPAHDRRPRCTATSRSCAATRRSAPRVEQVLDAGLPALPVVDADDRLRGIFGERELITALFPGYLSALGGAGFVPKSVEAALEKRQACRLEPGRAAHEHRAHRRRHRLLRRRLAEIFLHHRVLILPVTDDGARRGVITRRDFFQALVERLR